MTDSFIRKFISRGKNKTGSLRYKVMQTYNTKKINNNSQWTCHRYVLGFWERFGDKRDTGTKTVPPCLR